MKFSVLLPTRNGGPFLENCIRSILDQDCADMELIVSDNANTDNTPDVIRKFANDPRVKSLRLEDPVSVTDNWNNAFRMVSGEYVLMMGDDDYLLPGYFSKMENILATFDKPDCVIYNAFSYVAPGSISNNKHSFYSKSHFNFGPGMSVERRLGAEECFGIARDMFDFNVRIPLNMQTTIFRKDTFMKACGHNFIAPFPDHYALNSMLLGALNWVVSPERLLVVGVSPKSFGHYVYSNRQQNGLAYLGISPDFEGRLPGSELLNGMHIWLTLLKRNFSHLLKEVEVDRAGYVRRQFYAWLIQWKLGALSTREMLSNIALLSGSDWMGLSMTLIDKKSWQRLLRMSFGAERRSDAEAQWHGLLPLDNIADIHQFALWLRNNKG